MDYKSFDKKTGLATSVIEDSVEELYKPLIKQFKSVCEV